MTCHRDGRAWQQKLKFFITITGQLPILELKFGNLKIRIPSELSGGVFGC